MIDLVCTPTAVGFTSAGVAAGSLAASMMSATAVANGGAIAAGSAVSICKIVAYRSSYNPGTLMKFNVKIRDQKLPI